MSAPLSQPAPRHLLEAGEAVSHTDGRRGVVQEAGALRATVRWHGGQVEEVDQLAPDVWPTRRGSAWVHPAAFAASDAVRFTPVPSRRLSALARLVT